MEIKDGNGKVEQPKPKDVTLTIRLKPDSSFAVEGPGNGQLFDEMKCFWLLEKGKDYIKGHNARAMQSKLVKPTIRQKLGGAFGRR